MKQINVCLLMMAVLMALTSCERRAIFDESDATLRLNLKLNVEIQNEMMPVEVPDVMCAAFFHTSTYDMMHRAYVGPTGGMIKADPGIYHLVVYSFDSFSTHVREEDRLHTIEAYSNHVYRDEDSDFVEWKKSGKSSASRDSYSYLDEPVIYEPSHFFVVTVENLMINGIPEGGDAVTVEVEAESLVKVYNLTIGPIVNAATIKSASAYITGQIQSVQFGTNAPSGDPATIYIELDVDKSRQHFVGTFHTFGNHPAAQDKVYLIIEAIDGVTGEPLYWEWDVSDQFAQSDINSIVIDDKIEMPEHDYDGEMDGFVPTVDDWDEGSGIEIVM